MTTPEPPYPRDRGLRRELLGLLLALAGAVTVLWVTATIDWRVPVLIIAAAMLVGGVRMGNRPDNDTGA